MKKIPEPAQSVGIIQHRPIFFKTSLDKLISASYSERNNQKAEIRFRGGMEYAHHHTVSFIVPAHSL